MLKELFSHGVRPHDGKDSCFKGLAIEKLWQDEGHYHIIQLDFSALSDECASTDEFN